MPQPVAPWLRTVILGLAALLLISWMSHKGGDTDAWWHLRTGHFILNQHRLPVPDPFAWTTYMGKALYPGEEITRDFNLTHEWLAQVVMYSAYASAGLTGLAVMRAIALSLFCALAGLMTYRRTDSFYRALGATLAVAIVMYHFTDDRPQYFTYVFLALTINLLDSRRFPWLLPPLFLVWANCHGGFVLGWVVVGVYCAESLYLRWKGKPWVGDRVLWLAGISAILVSGLNPNGFRVFEVLHNYRISQVQSRIEEWYPPNFWELSPFTLLLYGGLLILLLNRRKTRVADWLLLVAFGSAGLVAFRNVPFAVWVGAFVIAVYLPVWTAYKEKPIVLDAAVAVLLLAATLIFIVDGRVLRFQNSIDTPLAPAADFLLQNHVQGRLFNTYRDGGYLIWRLWPKLQVFADGRSLNESVTRDMLRIVLAADDTGGKSGEDLLNDYGIDVIVMGSFDPVSGAAYYLPAALADPQQTEWKLVYRDAQELIYMRRPPPAVQPLNPLDGLEGIEEQCSFFVNQGVPACTKGLIDIFTRIGDQARVRKWEDIRQNAHME